MADQLATVKAALNRKFKTKEDLLNAVMRCLETGVDAVGLHTAFDALSDSISEDHGLRVMNTDKLNDDKRRQIHGKALDRARRGGRGLSLVTQYSLLESPWADVVVEAFAVAPATRGYIDEYDLKRICGSAIWPLQDVKGDTGDAWIPYTPAQQKAAIEAAKKKVDAELAAGEEQKDGPSQDEIDLVTKTDVVRLSFQAAMERSPDLARFLVNLLETSAPRAMTFNPGEDVISQVLVASVVVGQEKKSIKNLQALANAASLWGELADFIAGGYESGDVSVATSVKEIAKKTTRAWREAATLSLREIQSCWVDRKALKWRPTDRSVTMLKEGGHSMDKVDKTGEETGDWDRFVVFQTYLQDGVAFFLRAMLGHLYDPSMTPYQNYMKFNGTTAPTSAAQQRTDSMLIYVNEAELSIDDLVKLSNKAATPLMSLVPFSQPQQVGDDD